MGQGHFIDLLGHRAHTHNSSSQIQSVPLRETQTPSEMKTGGIIICSCSCWEDFSPLSSIMFSLLQFPFWGRHLVTIRLHLSCQLSLTWTWSSSMPAVTMPSPANTYAGSTWRQIIPEDSPEELWSFTSSMLSRELLRPTGVSVCAAAPKCCQLKPAVYFSTCQPDLCRPAHLHDDKLSWYQDNSFIIC